MAVDIINDPTERWTPAEAAAAALELQGACNLGGVTRAMHEIFRAYALKGTLSANQSAPMKLAMHQAAWLSTGQLLLADDEYSRVHRACEEIAGMPWAPKTSE